MDENSRKGRDPMRSLRVPDSEWVKWKRAAAKEKITLSQLIRKLLNAFSTDK